MKNIYIIFDSPPNDGASNFVDVEDGDSKSLSPEQTGATWRQLGKQSWALGPFASQTDSERELLEKIAAAAERLTHAFGPGGYVTTFEELKGLVEELDTLRGSVGR